MSSFTCLSMMTVEMGRTGLNLAFFHSPSRCSKTETFLCVSLRYFATLFDEILQNICIETNGGDIEIFSVLFDSAVKDKQMPFIPEKK